MTAIPIAPTPSALTADWLTSALAGGGHLKGARVTSVSLHPLGTGQMCDSVRVALSYDRAAAGPTTLIAKLPATDPTSRATAMALRSYEKEVRFYQQLAPHLPVRTPSAYCAQIDLPTAAFVLLLEDLAPAAPGDQLAGCVPEVAQVAVAELVGLHAARWNDPDLAAIEWLHGDPEASRMMMLDLLPALWQGFRERFAPELPPHVLQAGQELFGHLEPYLTQVPCDRTIVHGDYRLDNLLFHHAPGGVMVAVVDWQTCTVGPGPSDVAYFIGAGLLPEVRRALEEDLVRQYHLGLMAAGVSDYGWARCWQDYRRGTWAGLVMAVGASMMVERTPRGDQMFLAMASRHARQALDLEAPDLL